MNNYYTDIEFKTKLNIQYWFPFFFSASNEERAKRKVQSYLTALNDNYEVTNHGDIELMIDGMNSERIQEYVNKNLQGQLAVLNTNVWEINGMDSVPEFNLNSNMELLMYNQEYDPNNLAVLVKQLKIPVKKLSLDFENKSNDNLLINVVIAN